MSLLVIGDGNDFPQRVVWPTVSRLLAVARDESAIDVACSNGLTTRWLHDAGARVRVVMDRFVFDPQQRPPTSGTPQCNVPRWGTMDATLTADDLWPLVQKLPHDEQLRLAKLALDAASIASDAEAYRRAPKTAAEFSTDAADSLAWEGGGWEGFDAARWPP